MPASDKVNLEDYADRKIIALAADRMGIGQMSVGPKGEKRNLSVLGQGGRGFMNIFNGGGWAFSDFKTADKFLKRLRAEADPDGNVIVGITVQSPINHLKNQTGQLAYIEAMQAAIDSKTITKRAADAQVAAMSSSIVQSTAKSIKPPTREKFSEIKSFKDLKKAVADKRLNFADMEPMLTQMQRKALPITNKELSDIGMTAADIARDIADPELADVPFGSVVALLGVNVSQAPERTGFHYSYPWTIHGDAIGYLNKFYNISDLSTEKRIRNAAGQVTAQPLQTVLPVMDNIVNTIKTKQGIPSDPSMRYMPSDTAYLSAVEKGDTQAAQRMVDEAAKAAGYTIGPVYHGTPTGGFNVFDKRMRGETSGVSRQAFSFTTNQKAAENYSKRLGDEAVRLDAGLRVANDAMRRFDDDVAAQEYFSSKGYTSVEYGMLPEFDWGSIEDVPEFIKELRGYAKDLKPINPDLASSFVEAAKVMSSTKAVPEVKRVFLRIPENAPVFQATPSTLGMVMRDFSAEREPTKAGIVELPGNERIYYVADSSQVKLADPVTKDAQGNVIPLSKRFQASSEDIRYMPGSLDESTGLPLNSDGTVTVYHHTNKKSAQSIQSTGILKSAGEPDVYVTTEKNPVTGYGSEVVRINVDPLRLQIDDEFPDGRKDFRLSVGKPGGSIRVNVSQDLRFMPQPDSSMPGAYSFQGGYRAIPGKTKGSLRLYGPAGSLIGIAASLDEAQRIIRRKATK
jgi:hypothetical protein